MPKFKVVLVYEHKEVFKVEAESKDEAFGIATRSIPDEVWDCSLLDADVYEMK